MQEKKNSDHSAYTTRHDSYPHTMTGRRSARANKGKHPKRDLDEYLKDERSVSSDDEHHTKRQLTSANDTEYVDPSPESSEGDVRCTPCGTDKNNYDEENDDGGTFIQCDSCSTWQHAKCMGYSKPNLIPDTYKCDVCVASVKDKPQSASSLDSGSVLDPSLSSPPAKKSKKVAAKAAPAGNTKVTSLLSLKDANRSSTAKAFYNYFKRSLPAELADDEKDVQATAWAIEIEHLIFENYPNKRYIEGGRRILFLLKKHFMGEILDGSLTFPQLINKSPKEINQDIEAVEAKVKGNIKNIILRANEPSEIIRRTHRGEEIRENENDQMEEVYLNISVRNVDHRVFPPDSDSAHSIGDEAPVTLDNRKQQEVYNNLNPRFDDDDDEQVHQTEPQVSFDAEGVNTDNRNSKDTHALIDLPHTVASGTKDLGDELGSKETDVPLESVLDTISDLDLLSILSDTKPKSEPVADGASLAPSGTAPTTIWNGSITFPDYACFSASAQLYSTLLHVLLPSQQSALGKEIFTTDSYVIEGRLDRARADAYLNKIVQSRGLYVTQLVADPSTKSDFEKLYLYLISESKVGVLSGKPWFVKDSYLLAIDFGGRDLPSYLHKLARDSAHGLFVINTVKNDYVPSSSGNTGRPTAVAPTMRPQPATDLTSIMNQLNAGNAASIF